MNHSKRIRLCLVLLAVVTVCGALAGPSSPRAEATMCCEACWWYLGICYDGCQSQHGFGTQAYYNCVDVCDTHAGDGCLTCTVGCA